MPSPSQPQTLGFTLPLARRGTGGHKRVDVTQVEWGDIDVSVGDGNEAGAADGWITGERASVGLDEKWMSR